MITFRRLDDAIVPVIRQALDHDCPRCRARRGSFCGEEERGEVCPARAAANDPA